MRGDYKGHRVIQYDYIDPANVKLGAGWSSGIVSSIQGSSSKNSMEADLDCQLDRVWVCRNVSIKSNEQSRAPSP